MHRMPHTRYILNEQEKNKFKPRVGIRPRSEARQPFYPRVRHAPLFCIRQTNLSRMLPLQIVFERIYKTFECTTRSARMHKQISVTITKRFACRVPESQYVMKHIHSDPADISIAVFLCTSGGCVRDISVMHFVSCIYKSSQMLKYASAGFGFDANYRLVFT